MAVRRYVPDNGAWGGAPQNPEGGWVGSEIPLLRGARFQLRRGMTELYAYVVWNAPGTSG